tara:strand:+ start:394 stop:825 length:432 start_codon:yes stop_codon:yes gene_type:complete
MTKPKDIKKEWFVIDASTQPLGRMASQIAHVLRGKHKPTFVPHLDCGDNVVVINADKLKVTGRKLEQKVYYRHSNFIGGIKSVRAQDLLSEHPDRIVVSAVRGMLPKNKLGRKVLANLKVYAGEEHPHQAQQPQPIPDRTVIK